MGQRVPKLAIVATAALIGLVGMVVLEGGAPPSRTATKAGLSSTGAVLASRATPSGFTLRPGEANDVGDGANGSAWVVGVNALPGGFGIWHWTGGNWAPVPGAATSIAVGPHGDPWVVNSLSHIYHWNGTGWALLPGEATDVGVGANGAAWVVGVNRLPGGSGIWHWTGTNWAPVPGAATRIAVGPHGDPWVVNSFGHIYHGNRAGWALLPGEATDVGANDSAWVVGVNRLPGGSGLWHWTGTNWAPVPGAATRIAVGPHGDPWVVNSGHQIWSYGPLLPSPPPVLPPATTNPPGNPCIASSATGHCPFGVDPAFAGGDQVDNPPYVDVNEWSPINGYTETLTAYSPENFKALVSAPAGNDSVVAFTNVGSQAYVGMPVDGFSSFTSSFNESMPHNSGTSSWGMYDVWFDNMNYEVMIQFDFSNNGDCDSVARATFLGQPWHLCDFGSTLAWKLGTGEGAQKQSESSGTIDLKAMIEYLETHNYLPANSTWSGFSAGWEICSTGGQNETYQMHSFSVSAH